MASITKDPERPIIEDFRKEIQASIIPEAKPPTTIINFRAERRNKIERPIVMVPIDRLRYVTMN